MNRKFISSKTILSCFLIWLVITQSFQWLAFNRLRLTEPDKKDYSYTQDFAPVFDPHPLNFLEMHARFDTAWYFGIAYQGYQFSPNEQSNVNFFPLYPLLIKQVQKLLSPIFPSLILYHHYLLAGLLISLISLALSALVLYRLFLLDSDPATSSLAIFLFLVFPTSFFLTSIYSESLFLLFSSSLFYLARKRQFLLAGLTGFLAALTRPIGILLILPLVIEVFLSWQHLKPLPNKAVALISILLPPLGLLTFAHYLNLKFGSPFLFLTAAQSWQRTLSFSPLSSLANQITQDLSFTHASSSNVILELFFLAVGISLAILSFKRVRASYSIYSLLLVVFPLLSGVLVSQGRYTLVIFPLFLTLAQLLRRNLPLLFICITVSLLLQGLLSILFVNGYMAG